jgi:hypothetical protein
MVRPRLQRGLFLAHASPPAESRSGSQYGAGRDKPSHDLPVRSSDGEEAGIQKRRKKKKAKLRQPEPSIKQLMKMNRTPAREKDEPVVQRKLDPILPGESFGKFSRRIAQETRETITEAQKKALKTNAKRKS